MNRDIRKSPLFKEAHDLYRMQRNPGSGLITDAMEVNGAPDGNSAVFTCTLVGSLQAPSSMRICCVDTHTRDIRVRTFGPNSDRLAKYSADGSTIAFLSDRRKVGDFQLYFLCCKTGEVTGATPVEGWLEYFHWSPSGHALVLGVAGYGANPTGKYFERSPIMHAHKVKTPTLNITGALDRCTPPEEAAQFHNALLENNVKSVLVVYQEEGHGVRQYPVVIDYVSRVVSWFEEHLRD